MSNTMQAEAEEVRNGQARLLPSEVTRLLGDERRRLAIAGVPASTIQVGERLDDFTLPDALGRRVSLRAIVDRGPAVLVFYRGGWCPYCNVALARYQRELLPKLAPYRATLVAITPERSDESVSLSEKHALRFPVLTDTGAYVAKGLGIVWTPNPRTLAAQRSVGVDITHWNDSGTPDLPMPTVAIVDRAFVVRFIDIRPDYSQRTEVTEIMAALRRLG